MYINNINSTTQSRNVGLDIYRITAINFITILHIINQHYGLLCPAENNKSFYFSYFLEYFCYSGVNCFALLSGYLNYDKYEKYNTQYLLKILLFWIHVVIISSMLLIIFCLIVPIKNIFNLNTLLSVFLPITHGNYWYITNYIGLMTIMPIINRSIKKMSPNELILSLIIIIITFSVIPTLTHKHLLFGLNNGYSILWLTCCYYIGAIIKIYIIKIKQKISRNISFVSAMLCVILPYSFFILINNIFSSGKNFFLSYLSPFMLFNAFFLLIFFSYYNYNKINNNIIIFLSSNSLGVYLFQCHPIVWQILFDNNNNNYISLGKLIWKLPIWVMSIFFLGCIFNYFSNSILKFFIYKIFK